MTEVFETSWFWEEAILGMGFGDNWLVGAMMGIDLGDYGFMETVLGI